MRWNNATRLRSGFLELEQLVAYQLRKVLRWHYPEALRPITRSGDFENVQVGTILGDVDGSDRLAQGPRWSNSNSLDEVFLIARRVPRVAIYRTSGRPEFRAKLLNLSFCRTEITEL